MKLLDTVKLIWQQHNTKILTGVAVAGAIITPILASKATLKAKDEIIEHDYKVRMDDYKKLNKMVEDEEISPLDDKVFEVYPFGKHDQWYKSRQMWLRMAKIYGPAVVSCAITILCIISCHKIHIDRELELAAMSAMWESRYRVQTERLEELYPNDSMSNLERDGDAEREKPVSKKDVLKKFKVYDEITDQILETDLNRIVWANYAINERFQKGQCVYWGDVIVWLGGKKTGKGKGIGWDPTDDEFMEMMDYNVSYVGTYWIDIWADMRIRPDKYPDLPHLGCDVDPFLMKSAK